MSAKEIRANPREKVGIAVSAILVFTLVCLGVLLLYGATTLLTVSNGRIEGVTMALIFFALTGALVLQVRESNFKPADLFSYRPMLQSILAHTAAALLTFALSHNFHLGPVVASSLVGLLGGLILPSLGVEIYCGSFVGMCALNIMPATLQLAAAGIIAGLVFHLSRSLLGGFGGKLGTIAFCSVLMTRLILGQGIPAAAQPTNSGAWLIIISAVAAAIITRWVSDFRDLGVVLGSPLVGLAGGLLLPFLLPEQGVLLAVVVHCASFAGMSSVKRLANYGWLAAAGLVTGFAFFLGLPLFNGIGGKLGTTAFGASLVVWAFSRIFHTTHAVQFKENR